MTSFLRFILLFIVSMMLNSCFSSFESTKKITDSDVDKEVKSAPAAICSVIDTVLSPNYLHWDAGKRFVVLDEQVKLILSPATADLSEGDTLVYSGCGTQNMFGIEETVLLNFSDSKGDAYSFDTGRSQREYAATRSTVVPFLLDADLLDLAREDVVGKYYYVRTSYWYDSDDKVIAGKKFVKVKILDVVPGNKVYSLKVYFDYAGLQAAIYVSAADNSVASRRFSNLFSTSDIRNNYPAISDENWTLITESKVQAGMTKEECRLALGVPAGIDRIPTYDTLQEIWKYSDGVYLIFVDGILTKYRK